MIVDLNKLAKKVDRLIDQNFHTEAMIVLGRAIPRAEKEVKALEKLHKEHLDLGYMVDGMIEERRKLTARIKVQAIAAFRPEQMALFEGLI